jgi:hypothetical protein
LHCAIGDLDESTAFRDEANGSWHNGASPGSRGVPVVDPGRKPLKVQGLSSLQPELIPSCPASVLAPPRSWRRITRWGTVVCTAASVLALPQEDLPWNSVSAVGWKCQQERQERVAPIEAPKCQQERQERVAPIEHRARRRRIADDQASLESCDEPSDSRMSRRRAVESRSRASGTAKPCYGSMSQTPQEVQTLQQGPRFSYV